MKNPSLYSLLILLTIIGLGCKQPAGDQLRFPEGRTASEYIIENIGVNGMQRARRYSDKGILVEEGYLVNGLPNGAWTQYDVDQITRVTSYVNGYKQGVDLGFSKREQIDDREMYNLGVKNGRCLKYELGRLLEEATYKDGKLEGKMLEYHSNGNVKKEVDYNDGVMHGKFRYYDPDGNLTLEYEYANGEKVTGGIVSPPQ